MKIAVTGCSGSVGGVVVQEAISRGHTVIGIDKVINKDSASLGASWLFVEADLTDYAQVVTALRGCEAVIHLAGVPHPEDYQVDTHNNNVVVSWNVLRASAEKFSESPKPLL